MVGFDPAGAPMVPPVTGAACPPKRALHGRDFTQLDTSTSWQRERAQPPLTPIADQFTGRHKAWSRVAVAAVGLAFWAAFFAWALC